MEVLYADADGGARVAVEEAFAEAGAAVSTADSADAALAALAERSVDCLVCEHDLPDGDARSLLASTREAAPETPVVVYTAAGSESLAGELLAAGADGYVPKDAGVDVLVERVRELAGSPAADDAPNSPATSRARAGGSAAGPEPARDASLVVEQAPMGIVELDREFRVTGWNAAAAELLGHDAEAALGRRPWEFVVPGGAREEVRSVLRRLRDGGEPVHNVNENVRADGTTVTCEWHNAPMVEDGEVVGVLAFVQDVTDEVHRAEQLEALQETGRALMRADSREAVAWVVVDAAETVLEKSLATVRLADPDGGGLRMAAVSDRLRERTGPPAAWPTAGPGDGALWTAFERGERTVVEDISGAVSSYDAEDFPDGAGLLVEPLGDHGVLAFSTREVAGLDATEARMTRILATTATTALDRADRTRELERYETIVRAAGDGVFAVDADGYFVQVNDRFASVTGYDRDALVGEHASVLHDEQDLERAREQIHTLLEGDRDVVTYELGLRTADDERLHVEVSQSLLPGEEFTGTVGTARLIERRKRMERELRERKRKTERLHEIATRLQECECAGDISRVCVEAAEDILDFDDCSVRLVEGDSLVLAAASSAADLSERLPLEGSFAGRTLRDGTTRVVDDVEAIDEESANPRGYRSVLSVPLGDHGLLQTGAAAVGAYDEDDAELAELLAAHVRNALDRVSFQSELRAERDRHAALFDNVPDPVVGVRHTDDGRVVQSVNPAFERVFGFDADELVGEPLREYIVPPDQREATRHLDRPAVEGDVLEAEVRRRTADGLREFDLTVVPVDLGGESPTSFNVYADVTERKQRRRRVEVLNRVLRHDLRNGMNIVRGAAELLAERVDDGGDVGHAETIVDRADELIALADRTRAVERTLDREADSPNPVDLAATVRESVDALREEYPAAAFSLECPDGPVVAAGSRLLSLAIHDLLENAVVHNDRPDPTVSVVVDHPDDVVVLRVADDGPGIPEEERRLLTGEQEITQLRHASGLGLWLANWAVTHAGGELAFADNEPRGSVVEVRLPVADARRSVDPLEQG